MASASRSPGAARSLRRINLERIRAVGFDLDHTLAVYDDDAVNAVACAEAARLLVEEAGYPQRLVDARYDGANVARGLMMDFRSGAVVKLDETRRVRRAYHGGRWLDTSESSSLIDGPIASQGAHPLHSPFDLPTGWLFMKMVSDPQPPSIPSGYARVCNDIRHMLDRSHTCGELKARVMEDLPRFVRPLTRPRAFAELRDSGLTLFVLTNSERDYAIALLDYLFASGESWRSIFDDVVVGAGKPAFFTTSANSSVPTNTEDPVHEGGSAHALEKRISLSESDVLYVGDHAEYDIASASRHGWRTAHVLPELISEPAGPVWGSVFHDGGGKTWFSRLVIDHADVVASGVEELLPGLMERRIPPGQLPVCP